MTYNDSCRDGTPSPPLEQRIEAGLRLFEERRAENVIFSGGHPGEQKLSSMQQHRTCTSLLIWLPHRCKRDCGMAPGLGRTALPITCHPFCEN